MTPAQVQRRTEALPAHDEAPQAAAREWLDWRITLIWALLFFNGLPFTVGFSVLPMPTRFGQLISACALGLAALLALALNPRMVVRPNVVLGLATLLGLTALMTSVRFTAGFSALMRCVRLSLFLLTLWLLTPWFARRMMIARAQFRVLIGVGISVVLGVILAPGVAIGGRLSGVIWPVPATQVGEFAALASGMAIVLWLTRNLSSAKTALVAGTGLSFIVLSHTRTATIGLVLGLLVAGMSLFLSRRRVRRSIAMVLLIAPMLLAAAAPAVSSWVTRDQTREDLQNLTGRKAVWEGLVQEPRPEFNQWFGYGLSDKSFKGLPIDSTWLAVYQDEGLFGVAVIAVTFLFLVLAALFCPAGPERALALFLVTYCICASYTEVGMGDASPYVLHIMAAASLIVSARATAHT